MMQICSQCGVIAPTDVDKCDACKAPLTEGTRRTVEDRSDGTMMAWASPCLSRRRAMASLVVATSSQRSGPEQLGHV